MKKFILKVFLVVLIVYVPVIAINYLVDPANIYHSILIDYLVEELSKGNIVESPGDMDEGIFQEKMISTMDQTPDTVIIGSSHVMYELWEFDNYYVAGLSGAYLGDYYAIVGLLESYNKMPRTIVIGVDPWAFTTGYSDGRHKSIGDYAEKEYEYINNKSISSIKTYSLGYREIKELLSFSYFQASVKMLNKHGVDFYLSAEKMGVKVVSSDMVEDTAKIMPNGRRIMSISEYKTTNENEMDAQAAIDSGYIYQLGEGLSSLNEDNFIDFKKLIFYLQNKGVEIEIYLPSWHPILYDYFVSSGKYNGIFDVEKAIRKLGEDCNIMVRGSYDPYQCGVTEDDFADWLHLTPDKMMDNYNVVID